MLNIISVFFAVAMTFAAGDGFVGDSLPPVSECPIGDLTNDPDPPEYYRIDLVPTRSVPRIRSVDGYGDMFYQSSPFGVAIGSDGSYRYKIRISLQGLPEFDGKSFTVWLTTPDLSSVQLIGQVGVYGHVEGYVDWNKFLVVVSLEDSNMKNQERWQGPIAYRGMSRSGLMHTMAGHGPFQQEPCQTFGFQ